MKKIDNIKPVDILLVEDNDDDILIFKRIFGRFNLSNTLHIACSGKEALKFVREKYNELGLILLDYTLPEINGDEVVKILRADKNIPYIPVIMVTGRGDMKTKVEGLNIGADDYITKPFDASELIARINAMLRIKQLHDDLRNNLEFSKKLISFAKNLNTTSIASIQETLKEDIPAIFGTNSFSIFIYNKEEETLILSFHNQDSIKDKQIEITGNDKSVMWKAVKKKRALFIEDFEKSPFFSGHRLHPQNFAVCIPLIINNEVIAVVNLNNSEDGKLPFKIISKAAGAIEHLSSSIANVFSYEMVQKMSITDELTGIYNRRYFLREFKKEFAKARRYKRPLSLMMIDVDNLKEINDTYSHLCGDVVLKKVADIIKTSCREGDTFGRYGGDEFLIISPETTKEKIYSFTERIINNIKGYKFECNDVKFNVTVSIGICSFPEKSIKDETDMLRFADERMYKVKRQKNYDEIY